MGYIERNLLPGERVLFRTRKHVIIFTMPCVFLILSCFATYYMLHDPILSRIVWTPWLVTGLFWAYVAVEYYASEYAVTDKRVMMREGFFNRHANELRLSTISQVNIDQSLVGQILNFGLVSINAFGSYDRFATVAKPFLFQRAVNEQLDKLVK